RREKTLWAVYRRKGNCRDAGWNEGPGGGQRSPGREVAKVCVLVDIEVENIHDLKVRPIEQDQIAADHNVRIVRRGRRELPFQVGRAGTHLFLKPRRQS